MLISHRGLGQSTRKLGGAHSRPDGHYHVRRHLAPLDALPNLPSSPVHSLVAPERRFSCRIGFRLRRTSNVTLGPLSAGGAGNVFPLRFSKINARLSDYIYIELVAALCFLFDRLDCLRLALILVYFWAGFHKLNVHYLTQVFPWVFSSRLGSRIGSHI